MGTGEDATTRETTTQPDAGANGAWFPCPYCGEAQRAGAAECASCAGLFEPLSRQATQNHMGPWQVRDPRAPFMPGRSYATIRRMAQRGKLAPTDVLRGPTTRQFWMAAAEIPGVAHLLGRCHSCKREVKDDAFSCDHCGAVFPTPEDRQGLGLAPVRLLPGQAPATMVARSAAPVGAQPAASPAQGPTAFAALAKSSASAASAPRPSEPARLAPAASAAIPTVALERHTATSPPDYSRALRASNKRVSALRGVVIALVVVNVVLLAVAMAVLLSGGSSGSGEQVAPDAGAASE